MSWLETAVIINLVLTIYLSVSQFRNSRKDKIDKEKLRLQKVYKEAYDKLLEGIRKRQHDFHNHITAIKGMNYIYQNFDELVQKQNEYCNKIMEDNSFNHLIYNCKNPVLDGFLYTKLMSALENGIKVNCNAVLNNIEETKYDIFDLIEASGILIDNAIEAVMGNGAEFEKSIDISIFMYEEDKIVIKVYNTSPFIPYEKIQSFFMDGYTTKEEGRGTGLMKLKKIAEKYNGRILVENIKRDNGNWVKFGIQI